MNLRTRRDSPQWPKLIGTAAASGLATLFIVRNFFPAEKKVRHSITARYKVGDDTFVRTMGHLLGPPLVKGNKITPLENGDEIFPAMLNAIRSAQRTITFENFLFREGEVSDAFAAALAERARNGVKVHFLQDALGCDAVHGRAMKLMQRAGVAVEIEAAAVPAIPGGKELLALDEPPSSGGTRRNREWVEDFVDWHAGVPEPLRWLLCDAMTSGGLLIAAADGPGTRIGSVSADGSAGRIRVR